MTDTKNECDCGPAKCKRMLEGGHFIPPPGWIYQPDLQKEFDRYRFLRKSETEMGPKAEIVFGQLWLEISKKGIDGKRMDEVIDAARNAYYAAAEEDEEDEEAASRD